MNLGIVIGVGFNSIADFGGAIGDALLLESGDFFLLETGDFLLI